VGYLCSFGKLHGRGNDFHDLNPNNADVRPVFSASEKLGGRMDNAAEMGDE
jgi:hypothetical protein